MRTYHLSQATIENSPTDSTVRKVLVLKFRSFEENYEREVYADLFGFETTEDIAFKNNQDMKSAESCLSEVVKSLISTVGDGHKLDWTVPDLDERISNFKGFWGEQAFRNALKLFGVTKRLTMEQACRVLMEYYVVEPVMNS